MNFWRGGRGPRIKWLDFGGDPRIVIQKFKKKLRNFLLLRFYRVDSSSMLPLAGLKTFKTRGHLLKIQKRYRRIKLRANIFSFRIVNMWNGLPDDVVKSPTLNSFKGRIDRHWRSLRYSVFWLCLLMIWLNWSDLISPKVNNGLLQPWLQHDDDDDGGDCYGNSVRLSFLSYVRHTCALCLNG